MHADESAARVVDAGYGSGVWTGKEDSIQPQTLDSVLHFALTTAHNARTPQLTFATQPSLFTIEDYFLLLEVPARHHNRHTWIVG